MVRQSKQALELEQRVARLETQLAQGSASGTDVLQERLLALEQNLSARFDLLAVQFQSLRSCQQELLQVCKSLNPQAQLQASDNQEALAEVSHEEGLPTQREHREAGTQPQQLETSPKALLPTEPQPPEGEVATEVGHDQGPGGRGRRRGGRGRKHKAQPTEEEPQGETPQREASKHGDQQSEDGVILGRRRAKAGKDIPREAAVEAEERAACPFPEFPVGTLEDKQKEVAEEAEEAALLELRGASTVGKEVQEEAAGGQGDALDAAADALLDDVAVEPSNTQPESVTLPTTEMTHVEASSHVAVEETPTCLPDHKEALFTTVPSVTKLKRDRQSPSPGPQRMAHRRTASRQPPELAALHSEEAKGAASSSSSVAQDWEQKVSATAPPYEGDAASSAQQPSPAVRPADAVSSTGPEEALQGGGDSWQATGRTDEAADRPPDRSMTQPRRKKRRSRLPDDEEAQAPAHHEEPQVSTSRAGTLDVRCSQDLQSTSLPVPPATTSDGKGELDREAEAFLDDLAGEEEVQDTSATAAQEQPLHDVDRPAQQVEVTQELQQPQLTDNTSPDLSSAGRPRSRSSSCPKAHYKVSHPAEQDEQPALKRPRNDCDKPVMCEGGTQENREQPARKRPCQECAKPPDYPDPDRAKPSGFLSDEELRWAWYSEGQTKPFLEWCKGQPRSCSSSKCIALLCRTVLSREGQPKEAQTTAGGPPTLPGPAEEFVPPTTAPPTQDVVESPACQEGLTQAASHEEEASAAQLDAPRAAPADPRCDFPNLSAQDEPTADMPQSALAALDTSPPTYAADQAGEALRGRRKKQEWYKQRYGQASEANAAAHREPALEKRPPRRQSRRQGGAVERWPTFAPLPHYVPAGGGMSALQASPRYSPSPVRSPVRSPCAPASPVDDVLPPLL